MCFNDTKFTWRQFADARVGAEAAADLKARRDPLRVRAAEQLFGRLAKLQDLRQHGDSLIGILDALEWQVDSGSQIELKN